MKRIHLFEIEDQPWCPESLRTYLTDFISFMAEKADVYGGILPVLARGLAAADRPVIVDLASGSGGALPGIAERLSDDFPELRVLLTDYFPNVAAFERLEEASGGRIRGLRERVDARRVPDELQGFRTMFLSFHHFRPADAVGILRDAVEKRQPIGVFEGQQRDSMMLGVLMSPLLLWVVTPFLRPVRLGRLLFTYPVPIIPIASLWDGLVSCLRTYDRSELLDLTVRADPREAFDWEVGLIRKAPANKVLYLLGIPKGEEG